MHVHHRCLRAVCCWMAVSKQLVKQTVSEAIDSNSYRPLTGTLHRSPGDAQISGEMSSFAPPRPTRRRPASSEYEYIMY
jgi:hypothetical protein